MDGGKAHGACAKLTSGDARPKPSDSPLPTRCVKVTEDHVYLENTGGKKGKYITLSHRWHDNTAACNTTVSNFGDREKEVDVARLTPTFRDAIAAARGLQIPYIWIDSLCIIQSGDNGQDWKQEATRMGDYYQHSLFTICAISGSEGRGFLEMKSPGIESIAQLPFFEGGKRAGYMYAYRRPLKAERLFSRDVDQSNLMSRGWGEFRRLGFCFVILTSVSSFPRAHALSSYRVLHRLGNICRVRIFDAQNHPQQPTASRINHWF